jgi:hypothetical protein
MGHDKLKSSLFFTIAIYILTAAHHAYGAWIYDTPWRLHIVYHGLIVLLITLTFFFLYSRNKNRVFLFLYILVASIFFGGLIGLYEGGYNHLLKNILYFAGINSDTLQLLYPPPMYEMPNDFVFEVSGTLQFFTAILQLYTLLQLFTHKLMKNKDAEAL